MGAEWKERKKEKIREKSFAGKEKGGKQRIGGNFVRQWKIWGQAYCDVLWNMSMQHRLINKKKHVKLHVL